MIVRRIPTRRSLLEENRDLRVQLQVNNDVINDLLTQTQNDADLVTLGDIMAKRLGRSKSPTTRSLLAEWRAARGQ